MQVDRWKFGWTFATAIGHDGRLREKALAQIAENAYAAAAAEARYQAEIEAAAQNNNVVIVAGGMHITVNADTDDKIIGHVMKIEPVVKTGSTVIEEETPINAVLRTEFGAMTPAAPPVDTGLAPSEGAEVSKVMVPLDHVPLVPENKVDTIRASQDLKSGNLISGRPLPASEHESKEIKPANLQVLKVTVDELSNEAQASVPTKAPSEASVVAQVQSSSPNCQDLRVTIEEVPDEDLTRSSSPSPTLSLSLSPATPSEAQAQAQSNTANSQNPRLTIDEVLDEILTSSAPTAFEMQAQAQSPSETPTPAPSSSPSSSPSPTRSRNLGPAPAPAPCQAQTQAHIQSQDQAQVQAQTKPSPCPPCPPCPLLNIDIDAIVARVLNELQASRIPQHDDPMEIVQSTPPRPAGPSVEAQNSDVSMRDGFSRSGSDVSMRDGDNSTGSKSDVTMRDKSHSNSGGEEEPLIVSVEMEDAPPAPPAPPLVNNNLVINTMTLQEINDLLRWQLRSTSSSPLLGSSPVKNDEWPYKGRSMIEVWENEEGSVDEDGGEQMIY